MYKPFCFISSNPKQGIIDVRKKLSNLFEMPFVSTISSKIKGFSSSFYEKTSPESFIGIKKRTL
jgi:hypothetical protein